MRRQEALRPFDLARGPLLRTRLLRLGPEEHVLLLTVHHIAADLLGLGVLIREVAEIYARRAGAGCPSCPCSTPTSPSGSGTGSTATSWSASSASGGEQLDGRAARPGAPTDRPRPPVAELPRRQPPRGRAGGARAALAARPGRGRHPVHDAARGPRRSSSPRWTGQDDVVLGSPDRQPPAAPSWKGWSACSSTPWPCASASRRSALRAISWPGCGAPPSTPSRTRTCRSRSWSRSCSPARPVAPPAVPGRSSPSRTCRLGAVELPGLTLEPLEVESAHHQVRPHLHPVEGAAELAGRARVRDRPVRPRRPSSACWATCATLLAADRRGPETPVAELPLLSGGGAPAAPGGVERHAAEAATDAASTSCSPRRRRGRRTPWPWSTASERLTYARAATARAGRLARRLRALGVGPEVRVGRLPASARRSWSSPCWPSWRPAAPTCRSTPPTRRSGSPSCWRTPARPCCSTEPPRGPAARRRRPGLRVAGTRRRRSGRRRSRRGAGPPRLPDLHLGLDRPPQGGGDRAPQRRRPGALGPGGRSRRATGRRAGRDLDLLRPVGLRALRRRSPRGGAVILAANALALPELPARGRGVTLVNTVPSAMAELAATGGAAASVRAVNLAGEPLPRALADALHAQRASSGCSTSTAPRRTRPTRPCHADRAGQPARAADRPADRRHPGPRPRPRLRPVPRGRARELCLGGARPGARLPRPAGADGGAVRPRSVRRRARRAPLPHRRPRRAGCRTATLEYPRPADHQVKVRGFRIELGEIEAALAGIRACARRWSGARGRAAGDRGWWPTSSPRARRRARPARAAPPGAPAPRAHGAVGLRGARRAAADPQRQGRPQGPAGARAGGGRRRAAWRSARRPRSCWPGSGPRCSGVDGSACDDDFFALGGHSLLATQCARLRERASASSCLAPRTPISRRLQREAARRRLPLPSRPGGGGAAVASSRELSSSEAAGAAPEAAPRVRRAGPPSATCRAAGRSPLSFAQERLWFLDQLEPGEHALQHGRRPSASRARSTRRPWSGPGRGGRGATRRCAPPSPASDGAAVPAAWRRRAPAVPGRRPRGPAGGAPARPRPTAGRRRRRAGLRPRARAAAARASLLRLAASEHLLLAHVHHIVCDGWSVGSWSASWRRSTPPSPRAGPSPLPEPPVQYADFAVWQRRLAGGERPGRQLAYWRRAARRLPAGPGAAGRPAAAAGAELPRRPPPGSLAGRSAAALRALGRREGATLFMTLLAAPRRCSAASPARRTGRRHARSPAATAPRPRG